MKRPNIHDHIKDDKIILGDYQRACSKYNLYLHEKGARTNAIHPHLQNFVSGSHVNQAIMFGLAMDDYFYSLEASLKSKKSKEERIAELKKQIAEIEQEHEGNWILYKISPNGGSGQTKSPIAISENQEWLINYCAQTFSYIPSLDDNRPESDKNYLSPYYTIEEISMVIVLEHKIVGL